VVVVVVLDVVAEDVVQVARVIVLTDPEDVEVEL
jgi:hypothetical protein